MSLPVTNWNQTQPNADVEAFLSRPAFDEQAETVAREVLADIRARGLTAVLDYAERFDKAQLTPDRIRVTDAELAEAAKTVDTEFRSAVADARQRIRAFAQNGMKQDWDMPSPKGGRLGEQFAPLDRVGVYIPGGTAPLASSALMTAGLAEAAGVPSIVACTPCGPDLTLNPFVLYALQQAGATEIYRVGGIQAIGLMAYGADGIEPVRKIVGPGNAYVTAAKRQVYGTVALDLVAGPSEIAVLADASAEPALVAADLLSQAEHGTGDEKALLVSTSAELAEAVAAELTAQAQTLSRQEAIASVLANGVLLVVVPSLEDGIALCNRFAPEHLEVMVEKPNQCLPNIRNAGAIFVGRWTPESAGDFVAGPSHVLPTGGAAALFSGLTVDDFRKRSSVIDFTQADLQAALPVIEAFGRVEGLDAHARSARLRFDNDS